MNFIYTERMTSQLALVALNIVFPRSTSAHQTLHPSASIKQFAPLDSGNKDDVCMYNGSILIQIVNCDVSGDESPMFGIVSV